MGIFSVEALQLAHLMASCGYHMFFSGVASLGALEVIL